jgi:alkanesulfonate monooxygenase SsuD/methylene tetrahydromethanopterin reductase-like flavin-dependent oxidoreductase (luciferase family)
MTTGTRGFGINAGVSDDLAGELARRAEALGYASLWVTDSERGDGLRNLAAFARGSQHLRLGVGVVGLHRRTPDEIARVLDELQVPADRLWLGIGSGRSSTPLRTVREAVAALRSLLPGVPLVVSALGPRMRALAAEIADGVLLNWIVPSAIERARRQLSARPGIRVMSYVWTALGPGGRERLLREAESYAQILWYARTFAENGTDLAGAGLVAADREDLQHRLRSYETVLDDPIVRAPPATRDDPVALFALLEAAAPAPSTGRGVGG